jgi:hypothetical protein
MEVRTNWNDDRLDHLSGQVDSLRGQIDSLRHHMDERFERQEARIDAKFDGLQRTMILTLGGILSTFGGVFLAAQL